MQISAIILAAGQGQRYGVTKALALRGSKTFLTHQTELLRPHTKKIYAVVGCNAKKVMSEHGHLNVSWVINEKWQSGQFSSIKAGLQRLKKDEIALVLPVDVQGVSSETIAALIDAASKNPKASVVVPIYNDSAQGHPVVLLPEFIGEILKMAGSYRLDEAIKRSKQTVHVKVADPNILANVNAKVVISDR